MYKISCDFLEQELLIKVLIFLIFVSGDFLKYFIQVFSICVIIEIFYQLGTKILGLRVINLVPPNLHTLFLQKCSIWLEMNFEHVFRSVTFGASLTPSPLQVFNKCYTFWRLPILEKIDLLLQITFSRGIWVILTLNVLANNPTPKSWGVNFARPLCCYKNYPKPVKSLSFCKLRPVGEISEKHCSRKSLKISKKWSIGPYNGLNWSLNIYIFNFQLLETCHWIINNYKNWARNNWKQWKILILSSKP